MKYTQYLQFIELLEKNEITLEEFKKDPKLYEGILSNIGRAAWNLAKKGMKYAVSKGISANHKNQLNTTAEKIRTWIIDEVENGKTDKDHPLYKFFKIKEDNQKLLGDKTQAAVAKQKIRLCDREIAKFMRKKVDVKVRTIEQKIRRNENISDKDKDALEEYWDDLKVNLELSVAEALQDKDIISDEIGDDISNLLLRELKRKAGTMSRQVNPEQKPKSEVK